MKITLEREQLLDLQITLKKEYLLTNGRGGYCSSTLLDCHIRKYHGMLVLPIREQGGEMYNLLSKLEVKAIMEDKEFHLSTNKFPGVYHPTGHKYVEKFEMDYYPVTTYKIGDAVIVKSILMPWLSDTVLIRYDLVKSEKTIQFQATPLFAYRHFHSLSRENLDVKPRTYFEENGFKFDPYRGLPPVYIQTSAKSIFYPSPTWWKGFELLKERNRGYDHQEDLFVAGIFEIKLEQGQSVIFRASLSPASEDINKEWEAELHRIETYKSRFSKDPEPLKSLKTHSGHFMINYEKGQKGIIAGYHWFREWGRDTLISLAGLTLHRGEPQTALEILKKYTGLVKDGLIPNTISDTGNHAYNSVDSSLLYFRTVQQYLDFTKDLDSVEKDIVPALVKIIKAFVYGKVPDVWLSEIGFLYVGTEYTNLTWMDAVVNGKPVTPRNGAPVEINALWYNAMKFMLIHFPKSLDTALKNKIEEISEKFESNFENAFWHENDQCLVDLYWNPEARQNYIRPNQLFAIGLPYTCISDENALIILNTVRQHLVTPFGLRTLSPRNPYYKAEYKGSQEIRDSSYHMGMVWPWLIGIYMDALLKNWKDKNKVKTHIEENFHELWTLHLEQYGIFHISELFRPNPPYVAKACMAQAWSEAEVIRVLDTLKIKNIKN